MIFVECLFSLKNRDKVGLCSHSGGLDMRLRCMPSHIQASSIKVTFSTIGLNQPRKEDNVNAVSFNLPDFS